MGGKSHAIILFFLRISHNIKLIDRFRAALPEPPWNGEKRATTYGPQCCQIPVLTNKYAGQEDCLFLNVYLRDFPHDNSTIPVMVWFHGGAFKGGAGDFPITGPEYLIHEGVILVTLNYRLGPLGFLNLNTEDAPGNAGLQDQILALKWIRRNIRGFGGDPENILIFGQSAGAASVDALMLSPAAKGLFQKAITQSGSILNPWAIVSNPVDQAFRLGESLGFIGNSTQELAWFLKNTTERKLIENSLKLEPPYEERNIMNILFAPSIDKQSACNENDTDYYQAVLPEHPLEILKKGNYNHVPYMSGFTSDEGLIMFQSKLQNIWQCVMYFFFYSMQTNGWIQRHGLNSKIVPSISFQAILISNH